MTCDRVDRHDHDDARLPAWFHAWLRGERRTAPPLRSWMAQRTPEVAFGTVTGRRWSDAQLEAHQRFAEGRA